MSQLKTWYTAAELAQLKLEGLPASERNMRERAKRESWTSRQVAAKGGRSGMRTEFQPPKAVMDQIVALSVKASAPESTEVTIPAAPAHLKDWQRNTAEARAAICAEVKRLAAVGGTDRAIRTVVDLAGKGELPEHLQQLVAVANAKAGASRALSRSSIYRWLNDLDKGTAALAPKTPAKSEMPAWGETLLRLMANPQKPTLKACMYIIEQHLPAGVRAPSYWAADRFLKKMSKVEVQRGRMGSRELKNIRPFVRRDTSHMWPGDAYTADGHTFDAEIAHRDHGRAFRPEITTVADIATRRVVGWSVGLAESTWAVLDALRHACTDSGIPAIFYVDNGSGYKNAAMSHEAMGFMARLGITLTHSTPYNSQARGIIERLHQTIWVAGAKQLPTYMGADMDAEAKQKVYKLTRADIKRIGTSKLLVPWNTFIEWAQEQVENYNNKPHRSLPKMREPETGKLRHQSPNEAWAAAIDEGWKPTPVEKHEADDLFRPYKDAKVARGEIRLFNNLYFHPELEHYHGETVRVGYDLHDAQHIWVRNKAGQLVCVAEFEANRRSYFPESFIQQAAQKRAEGRIRRAEAKIEEAKAELDAPLLLEQQQTFELPRGPLVPRVDRLPSSPDVQIVENGVVGNVVDLPPSRPFFESEPAKYRWLLKNPKSITQQDELWLNYYRTTDEWADLFGEFEVAAR